MHAVHVTAITNANPAADQAMPPQVLFVTTSSTLSVSSSFQPVGLNLHAATRTGPHPVCCWGCRRVQGGSDKDALLCQLMEGSGSAHAQSSSSNANGPAADSGSNASGAAADTSSSDNGAAADSKLAVYVGDSPSDFAPLLRADLGIVVGQNKLLRQVAKAHGVKLKPLTAGQACMTDLQLSNRCNAFYWLDRVQHHLKTIAKV